MFKLLPLLAAIAPLASACNGDFEDPPLFWLAKLRNSTGIAAPDTTLKTIAPGLRRIRFEEGAAPIPITELEKQELEKTGLRYFDVTEDDLEAEYQRRVATGRIAIQAFPTGPTHTAAVKAVVATLSEANLRTDLAALTSYRTRYYRSTTGASAATALATKLRTIAASATGGAATVTTFSHSWGMSSIIARIEGTNPSAPVTIAGAHLDTINQSNPSSGVSPGADDNGSGSVNLIEAFRKLVAAGFKPSTPVEFHWYSGEEAGLLGSAAIARSYSSAGKQVLAMMNLDMTAWLQTGTTPQVGFVTDRTDAGLTAFAKTLVPAYLSGLIATNDFCGYACSDHASWNSAGYPVVYPFESITDFENPNIHTASDTSTQAQFSFAHAHEYTKLVVSFIMELTL